MSQWSTLLVMAALLAPEAATAQQVSPPPPLVKPEGLKAISDHVQVIPDNSVPLVPNVGYIVGDKGVLVSFRKPVRGLDPLGVLRHPELTVTVSEVERLAELLRLRIARRR